MVIVNGSTYLAVGALLTLEWVKRRKAVQKMLGVFILAAFVASVVSGFLGAWYPDHVCLPWYSSERCLHKVYPEGLPVWGSEG